MYLFYSSRIHVITLYSSHRCVYYASMLRCWHIVWILVMTDHPCLGVGCHICELSPTPLDEVCVIGKKSKFGLRENPLYEHLIFVKLIFVAFVTFGGEAS
jgi:magnesium-transporting ATPase (P-type)